MEATHVSRGDPRWFDHVFVSKHFQVDDCTHQHAFRNDELSDHSALLAALSQVSRESAQPADPTVLAGDMPGVQAA